MHWDHELFKFAAAAQRSRGVGDTAANVRRDLTDDDCGDGRDCELCRFSEQAAGPTPGLFYSWQLQNPEAVIIHLLLNYFILWSDGSEDRQAFEEYIERLKSRVAELEKKLYESRTEVHQLKAELEERREPDQEYN